MKHLILLILTFSIPILACSQPTKEQIKQVAEAKKEVKRMKGEPFPNYNLTDINGIQYSSDELKGKIVLFNFWFSRCGPCIQEIPELNELVEEYKDEVVFLAPTFDEKVETDRFLKKRNFEYNIVSDVKDFCQELNVRSYPTHFVVDRSGTIEKVVIGYSVMTVGALRKSIKKLLKLE
ncbi:MAG: TlpA family protein disulfide reductase [Ekhidna sp.]|nr:TlpA family protein disulfide reductase [Ekhidna sp.]